MSKSWQQSAASNRAEAKPQRSTVLWGRIGCFVWACCVLCGCAKPPPDPVSLVRQILRLPGLALPLEATVEARWKRRDLNYERVYFQGRYRQKIPALLCFSDLAYHQPLPAVLIMPGSTRAKEDVWQPTDLLGYWADAGFAAMSIDRAYQGERPGDLEAAVKDKGLLPVWGEYLYDLQQAVAYLESRPEIDAARLGMLGLSLGGWEALALAAVDGRVKVVVAAGGQLVWDEIWRTGAWRRIFPGLPLVRQLVAQGADNARARRSLEAALPGFDRVDALALAPLVAPRPLLLMVGADDHLIGVEAVRRTHAQAAKRYAAEKAADRLRLYIAPEVGHSFPRSMQVAALEWFKRWL